MDREVVGFWEDDGRPIRGVRYPSYTYDPDAFFKVCREQVQKAKCVEDLLPPLVRAGRNLHALDNNPDMETDEEVAAQMRELRTEIIYKVIDIINTGRSKGRMDPDPRDDDLIIFTIPGRKKAFRTRVRIKDLKEGVDLSMLGAPSLTWR